MFVPVVDCGFSGPDGFGHWQFSIACSGRDDGQSGAQRAIIEPGEEKGGPQSLGCDAVAVSSRDALDKAV